jgi:DHA3 family macrolide efflux protein-like MFS transporter
MNAFLPEATTSVPKSPPSGMLAFTIIWIGQMLSLLGTNMTSFALTVWTWQVTQQATAMALVGFFAFAPTVFVSPIAGALVDRYDRKKVMQVADLAAGLPTVAVLLLYVTGNLQIWHLFITGAISGTFQSFHFPAYSAAVTMMVHKEQYGRANGMLAAAQFAAMIFAPMAAAFLLGFIGIVGIMMIDIATFLIAISMLFFVDIPRPPATEAGRKGMGSIWKESFYGFRYIYERPSLLGLQLVFFSINLFGAFGTTVLNPMILARFPKNDPLGNQMLGSVQAAGGIGGLVGSILLTVWGGPKRKVNGVLGGMILVSLFGGVLLGLGQNVYVWVVTSLLSWVFLPIINGSNQAIWQAKVAPDVQGRVFATRLLIAQISVPIAMLLAGPLADLVFTPAMMPGGNLTALFGGVMGTGHGVGMSLMLIISGILGVLVGIVGYSVRTVRDAEAILPDHDAGIALPTQKQA